MEFINWLFSSEDWIPRGSCGNWGGAEVWYVSGSILITAAYLAIPFQLTWLWRRKRECLKFAPLLLWFGMFIVSCGMTHLLDAAAFVWPAYRFGVVMIWLTALSSWATFFYLRPASRHLSRWKTPDEYQQLIDELLALSREKDELLAKEKAAYEQIRKELHDVRNELMCISWKASANGEIEKLKASLAQAQTTVKRFQQESASHGGS